MRHISDLIFVIVQFLKNNFVATFRQKIIINFPTSAQQRENNTIFPYIK